ncbi:MAG: hemin uptake protein HemP [Paraburkholderia sp.]|jgi:hemin uptake protein HemP|nr:hemin uptake protein HemP [Paraburkholderia sp.]
MTEFNRSSTLSLHRSGAALTGARAQKPATPAVTRKSGGPAGSVTNAAASPQPGGERALESAALLQGRSHVSIVHNGETYQLRATRLGKLILTK